MHENEPQIPSNKHLNPTSSSEWTDGDLNPHPSGDVTRNSHFSVIRSRVARTQGWLDEILPRAFESSTHLAFALRDV
jgi:hypothetical protein